MMLLGLLKDAALGFVAMLPVMIGFQLFQRSWLRANAIEERAGHTIGIYVFSFLLAGVLTVTGIPSFQEFHWNVNMNLTPLVDIYTNTDQYIANAVLFIPYGLLLPLLWERFDRLHKVAISGFLFSAAIEGMQLFNYRATDIDDLIMNSLGAMLGYFMFVIVKYTCPKLLPIFRLEKIHMIGAPTQGILIKGEAAIYIGIAWLTTFVIQSYVSNVAYGVWGVLSGM